MGTKEMGGVFVNIEDFRRSREISAPGFKAIPTIDLTNPVETSGASWMGEGALSAERAINDNY